MAWAEEWETEASEASVGAAPEGWAPEGAPALVWATAEEDGAVMEEGAGAPEDQAEEGIEYCP